MYCAVPGTKYVLNKVIAIVIIKKMFLSSCSGEDPEVWMGLTLRDSWRV